MPGIMVPRRALVAAVLLRAAAAMKIMEDQRPAPPGPDPTPAPPPPTRAPSPEPTPEPTYTHELPGVPCQCNGPTCFARYDLNNDSCITQDECDLQWPLEGNCSGTLENPATYGPPVWDTDGDGCINFTEWDVIYVATNGSCCPQEIPEPCDECPPGYVIETGPCGCGPCPGEVRRRRSLECTPCPPPQVKSSKCPIGVVDECCDSGPSPCEGTDVPAVLCGGGGLCQNNSVCIDVEVPIEVCDEYAIGDILTLSGTLESDPATVISHTFTVTGVVPVTGGFVLQIHPPLTEAFSPVGGSVDQMCTSTDGTQVSAKFSSKDGGCCCICGNDPATSPCCESTEFCLVFPNGTGVCESPEFPKFSTPAPTVGARGDPHLVNLQGEHFDINHDGKFMLLRFPQAVEKPSEFTFVAKIQPEFGKPCTTYITEAELSGAWLGSKILQIRSYRKSRSNDTDTFFGARLLVDDDEIDPPWQTIEEFETKGLELSEFGIVQSFLEKATWFPKKRSKNGPTAAGMFTLSLKNMNSGTAAKIIIRQDLPEQEHLNVAVRQLSQLGRVDVGGLLGFDEHPESLERHSAACVHHQATARYRIESQDDADHGYYFRPAWKDRWDKARSRPKDITDASASLAGERLGGQMCKCSSDNSNSASIEGVLVEEASFVFAEASWE